MLIEEEEEEETSNRYGRNISTKVSKKNQKYENGMKSKLKFWLKSIGIVDISDTFVNSFKLIDNP